MNLPFFIASRTAGTKNKTYGKPAIVIAATGVALSVAIMLLSLCIIRGFKGTINSKITGFTGNMQVLGSFGSGPLESSPIRIPPTVVQSLKSRLPVRAAQPFIIAPIIINANSQIEGVSFKGVDSVYDFSFLKSQLVAGAIPPDSRSGGHPLLISSYLARRLKLKPGNTVIAWVVQQQPQRRKFTVCGIYDTGVDQVDKNFAVGYMKSVAPLLGYAPDEIGGLELRYNNAAPGVGTEQDVANLLPAELKAFSVNSMFPALVAWLGVLDTNINVIVVLMLLVGTINMVTALLIIILERTRFIGILKALGAGNGLIMRVFLLEGLYIIGTGMFAGNILGLGVAFIQHRTHIFKLDASSYFMRYVPIDIQLADVLLINAGTLFICFLALLLPAAYVTRIKPLNAIRFS